MSKKYAYLIMVTDKNNNKFYEMKQINDSQFVATYGRVGTTGKPVAPKSIWDWDKTIRSKVKKGYEDKTQLEVAQNSNVTNNSSYDNFFAHFAPYCNMAVSSNYIQSTCTKALLDEARSYLIRMKHMTSLMELNETALKVFTAIPRKMTKVQDHLLTTPSDKTNFINVELDMLDSMASSNIIHTSNSDTLTEMNISFRECNAAEYREIEGLINPSKPRSKRIHKCYAVVNTKTQKSFDDWVGKSRDKRTQVLMHGTRNANIFSIAKSGLFVRPPKGTKTTGSNYGYGIYHSAHTGKSLNYTGYDNDSIFFLQDVHVGKQYSYDGWYEDGKDKVFKSTSDLSYNGMQSVGCDSLYVVARSGGRLLNSEYIVYNSPQTTVKYIVWFK